LRRYDKLAQTYQVTFCSYTVFPNMPYYVNSFSLRHDINNELLSNAVRVIYVELSKLSEIIRKPVIDMTDMDKWALFFQYANIPEYRETVNNPYLPAFFLSINVHSVSVPCSSTWLKAENHIIFV
jgi:hypothetical protein